MLKQIILYNKTSQEKSVQRSNVCICLLYLYTCVGKYTNFNRTMEIFSLAVCSPIFGCVPEVARGKCLRPKSEWQQKSKRRNCFRKREIYRFQVTWPAPNARFIFALDKFLGDSKRTDILEDTDTWLLCPTRFPKLFNLFWHITIFVSGTNFLKASFGSYFSRIFHFMCSSPTDLRYRSVNLYS